MGQGRFKINQAIEVTYQAPNSATGKTVNMEVFDEAHTIVAGGPTVLTEIAATGRYYGTFTPDAEGRWNVEIEVSDGTGKVVKQYAVAGHDVDSIGDAVATADGKIDLLNDLSSGDVDTALASYDAATGAEVAALNDISTAEVNTQVDTALADYDAPTKAELDTAEGAIRGADDDTLKDLSDQIDGLDPSAGAMLG